MGDRGPVINIGTGVQLGVMYGQTVILFAPETEKALFFLVDQQQVVPSERNKKLKEKR